MQKLENAQQALRVMDCKLVSAEDIVDGNQKLMLGTVWQMIMKYEVVDKDTIFTWADDLLRERNSVYHSLKEVAGYARILDIYLPTLRGNPFEVAETEFGVPQLVTEKEITDSLVSAH
jgi:hypothetical protein